MAKLFTCGNGDITIDIDAMEPALDAVLDDDQADALVRCAVLMVVSSLLQGGHWPREAMRAMTSLMSQMKAEVCTSQLM